MNRSKVGIYWPIECCALDDNVIAFRLCASDRCAGGAKTNDGKAVIYPFRDQEADNLWLQPLDGSPGKQITNFKSERITEVHWSFDGSKLGMVRGHTDSDIVLMQESKP